MPDNGLWFAKISHYSKHHFNHFNLPHSLSGSKIDKKCECVCVCVWTVDWLAGWLQASASCRYCIEKTREHRVQPEYRAMSGSGCRRSRRTWRATQSRRRTSCNRSLSRCSRATRARRGRAPRGRSSALRTADSHFRSQEAKSRPTRQIWQTREEFQY